MYPKGASRLPRTWKEHAKQGFTHASTLDWSMVYLSTDFHNDDELDEFVLSQRLMSFYCLQTLRLTFSSKWITFAAHYVAAR